MLIMTCDLHSPHLGAMRAGNDFCGTAPDDLDGVIRYYTDVEGPQEVLERVTKFDTTCIPTTTGTIKRHPHAAVAGVLSMA